MLNRLELNFFRLLMRQFKEYIWLYLLAFIALYITHICQSNLPFFAKELGDFVIEGKADEIPITKYLLVALAIVVFRTSSRTLFFLPARYMQGHLMKELTTKLEAADPARFKVESSGQLYQKLFVDVSNLRGFVGFALLQLGNIIIALVVLIPKIIEFNPKLLVALSPLFITFIIFAIIMTYFQKFFRVVSDLQGEVQNFIIESYNGKQTIKNYHSENSFRDLFKMHSFKELQAGYIAGLGPTLTMPMVKFGVGISFLWGCHIIYKEQLGATSLILFSGFVFLFLEPLMFISWIGGIASRTWSSWKRIKELVDSTKTISDEETNTVNPVFENGEYQTKLKFWDKTLDINIESNEWSVFVGPTGVGKSYLMWGLARAFSQLGKQVSLVPQEPYLYNDSIRANIFLGQEITPEREDEARDMLKTFELTGLASSNFDLLDVEVGENGKQVSGGQAKRIALIRSLMSGAEIIIWDDPFSSVDLILEREIVDRLQGSDLLKGKTLILTSHRLSTVRFSKNAILLDQEAGVLESGNVNEKLNNGKLGEYFKEQLV